MSEQISKEDLDKLNKDIDTATTKIVSDDTAKKIQEAKEEAKKEAEKEMLTNQRIKELEQEKEKLLADNTSKEKEAAEQLAALKGKVDELTSSKAVVSNDSPFNETPVIEEDIKTKIDKLTEQETDDIQRQSFEMFWEQSQKPKYE